jgi:DNA-binding NarL/FixJ family response regulator
MGKTTVFLADRHVIFTEGLAALLRQEFDVCGVAHDGRTLLKMVRDSRPDVIVSEIAMSSLNGIDAARILWKQGCTSKFLFLTGNRDVSVVEEAFRAGASGFLLKICDLQELVNAIKLICDGGTYITPRLAGDLISALLKSPTSRSDDQHLSLRQREFLQLLAEGRTMKETAALLGISTRTAEAHKYEIMRRLGVETTAALIRHAVRNQLARQ